MNDAAAKSNAYVALVNKPSRVLSAAAPLACLWLILINQLRIDWSINPTYSYGWLVPFLALYLFWKSWRTRPEPGRPILSPALGLIAGTLACGLLPMRLIQKSAPYWELVSWGLTLQVVGLTLAALTYLGGWAWTRHFAGSVCFFLVAVPWPPRVEIPVTHWLMEHLAQLTAEILNWAGVFAVPEGNLIRLSTHVLGVDEACSGVRSLQSLLMVSLFLGELNRLMWPRRVALVFVGLGLALFCNVIRTLVLAVVANTQGVPALQKWHDPAGLSVFLVSFLGLYLVARRLRRSGAREPLPPPGGTARVLPPTWLWGMAILILVTELSAEAWYRVHEMPAVTSRGGWRVRRPDTLPEFREVPISDGIRKSLAYDEGCNFVWQAADESRWLMFFFKWHPTESSRQSARFHRPEICLPAVGLKLVEERPRVVIRLGDDPMSFRSYLFTKDGRPLHVFFSLREGSNGEVEAADMFADSAKTRLRRVLEGRRDLGQQSLEVVIQGIDSPDAAEAAFRSQMRDVIDPVSN